MCLALPARVIELDRDDQTGEVDLAGNRYKVNFVFIPQIDIGDWVLVHAGYAIQSLDPAEARETWDLVDDLVRQDNSQDGI